VIDIQISDGYKHNETLDILGRGSVLGFNNILNKEMWYYRAVNKTITSCKVIKISRELIK